MTSDVLWIALCVGLIGYTLYTVTEKVYDAYERKKRRVTVLRRLDQIRGETVVEHKKRAWK